MKAFIVALVSLLFIWGQPDINAAALPAFEDQKAACQALLEHLEEQDDRERRVYLYQNEISDSITIALWRGEAAITGGPGWLFFVDNAPRANWEHPCRFILASEDGAFHEWEARTPARDMSVFEEITDWEESHPNAAARSHAADETQAQAAESLSFTPAENRYAVIISGGYSVHSNYARYWNDCSYFFATLKQNGFLNDNIYVLMSDGTDPAVDRADGVSSPLDLNNDGRDDIGYSATKADLTIVFNELADKLGPDDLLFIFSTDHGGNGPDNPFPYDQPDVVLYLWGEYITGDELAVEVNKVNAGVIAGVFEQCFSGGIVEKLKAPNRVLMSASRWWELSYAMEPDYNYDEFSYLTTKALAEPESGDSNGDGTTTLEEAYLYALANDSCQSEEIDESDESNAGEHPSYYSNPWDLGRKVSLSGINPAASPPWYAGYVQKETDESYPEPGQAQGWRADDKVWEYNLAFAFPYGGAMRRTIYISSNGIVYFTDPESSGDNSVDGLTNAMAVAPLWDDLTTVDPENDIHIDPGLDRITIAWNAKTKIDQRPVNTAVRLYADGTITFFYGDGNQHTSLIAGRDKTMGVSLAGKAHLSILNGLSVLDSSPAVSFIPAFYFTGASDSNNAGCFLHELNF